MRQRTVFQIGVDLFDDRVLAVGLVGGDRVQITGGEERVEAVRVEPGCLAFVCFPIQLRNAPHDQAPLNAFTLLPRQLNAVKSISATDREADFVEFVVDDVQRRQAAEDEFYRSLGNPPQEES